MKALSMVIKLIATGLWITWLFTDCSNLIIMAAYVACSLAWVLAMQPAKRNTL